MLVDNIIDTVRAGIASSVAAYTDAGESPAQSAYFEATDSSDLEAGGMERVYSVILMGGGDRNLTGVPGRVDAFIRFHVRMRFFNESRPDGEALAYYGSDMRQIADRVPQIVMTTAYGVTGAGVGSCVLDGDWTLDRDPDEPSIWYGIATFLVEYYDVVVTS